MHTSDTPHDLVLAAAVREGILTREQAALIGRNRLEGVPLSQIAAETARQQARAVHVPAYRAVTANRPQRRPCGLSGWATHSASLRAASLCTARSRSPASPAPGCLPWLRRGPGPRTSYACRHSKRFSHYGGQAAAVRAVSIDVGIVDRHLQADCATRAHGDAQRRHQALPGQAVRPRIIHGLHDRLVQDIGVEVNPEPFGTPVTRQVPHSLPGSRARTLLARTLSAKLS